MHLLASLMIISFFRAECFIRLTSAPVSTTNLILFCLLTSNGNWTTGIDLLKLEHPLFTEFNVGPGYFRPTG